MTLDAASLAPVVGSALDGKLGRLAAAGFGNTAARVLEISAFAAVRGPP